MIKDYFTFTAIKSELQIEANGKYNELKELLDEVGCGNKRAGKFSSWTLHDCYEMQKFYLLIMNDKLKSAYNKLPVLWKEAALVPGYFHKRLCKLYDE
jgi:hypothetical protein